MFIHTLKETLKYQLKHKFCDCWNNRGRKSLYSLYYDKSVIFRNQNQDLLDVGR